MPAQIFGTDAVVTTLNRAFNDVSPSNATFKNQVAAAGTTTDSQMAFAKTFGAGYAGQTADALSTLILGNLGVLPNAALQTALKDYITAAGIENIGIIALQLGDILSGLENATGDQAGFKAAAVAWNNEVTAAYNYSSNTANTTPSTPGPVTTPGQTFTLTAAGSGDSLLPTSSTAASKTTDGDDVIRAVSANSLESIDSLDGGAGNDTLNISDLAIAAGAAPVLKSIETVNLTNSTANVALNLNDATGITAFNVTQAGGFSVTLNNASLDTVFTANKTAAAAVIDIDFKASTAGTNDTLKLAVLDNDANTVTFQSTADKNTIENVTLAANGGKGGVADSVILDNTVATSALAIKTLTVTGSGSVDVTSASANLKTVTATAATGNNTFVLAGAAAKTVTTGTGNDKITTGAGDDVINGGKGADTYTGAAGADKFFIETTTIEDLGFDTVTDFVAADGDTLAFVGAEAGTATNFLKDTAGGAGFVTARSAALTKFASDNAVKYVAIYDGADTYVFFDGNGDHALSTNGSDFAVKLTGVALADIAAANIVAGT